LRFWDSSAIVPLLLSQAKTEGLRQYYREDPVMLVWWNTAVECASALARVERERPATTAIVSESLTLLKKFAVAWQEIQPTCSIKEQAIRLLRVHNLRAGDALLLAAAILGSEHSPSSLEFVCLDDRLSTAAQREGFRVISPNLTK